MHRGHRPSPQGCTGKSRKPAPASPGKRCPGNPKIGRSFRGVGAKFEAPRRPPIVPVQGPGPRGRGMPGAGGQSAQRMAASPGPVALASGRGKGHVSGRWSLARLPALWPAAACWSPAHAQAATGRRDDRMATAQQIYYLFRYVANRLKCFTYVRRKADFVPIMSLPSEPNGESRTAAGARITMEIARRNRGSRAAVGPGRAKHRGG
jgi:hypothetical protein